MTVSESKRAEVAADRSAGSPSRPGGGLRSLVSHSRSFGSVLLLLALIVIFSATTDSFLSLRNVQNVLIQQAIIALMTFGVMFPLIVGEFDLSVGYMIGFLAILGAFLAGHGFGAEVVVPVMILGGALVGLVNGLLTVSVGISSFIATLGIGIVLQGLNQGVSGGKVLFTGIPEFVTGIGNSYAGPLAVAVWLALAVAAVLFYMLERTPVGRSWYAVGGSERVAFLAGLRTRRLKIAAFMLSGLLVGVGSVIALGQSGGASPGYGPDLLLPAYAAAFLGVTTYRPGRYNVVGSVVGILLLAVGFNGLSLLGVPFWVQPIFNGGVLLLAVILSRAEARKVSVAA
ncbi:ABC transporter permease [Solwaraspora sp. WMMD406]|uniref:ABC transporter permease n=1 Tax=Solwaraspora sp. WMMD406 TaxID=3016095 RepID=UPI002415E8C6|nr:ABC transporter permease [Solwaraspora sp. WMMD406]MDG4767996.1 ABC transporter permease [Solwaraspora sp. WMMD406]